MLKADNPTLLRAIANREALRAAAVPAALIALGATSLGLYHWGRDLHRFVQWVAAYIWLFIAQFAIYLAACYAVLGRRDRLPPAARLITVASVLLFAAAFRADLVGQRPYLSSDVYRYIWDGRVQAAGVNPYKYLPSADELEPLRDDKIFPNINRADVAPTPYPPAAQAVYLAIYLAYPSSVTAFKVAMSLFDVVTMLAIVLILARLRIDPARVVIFAWHPLLIYEGAHSGHIESVFICFLTLGLLAWAYRKHLLTGVAVGLAAMVKFYPAILLPVFYIRSHKHANGAHGPHPNPDRTWSSALGAALFDKRNISMLSAFVGVVVLAYAPYLGVGEKVFGYLPGEFKEEGFIESGDRYFLLTVARRLLPVPTSAFLTVAAMALAGLALWWLIRTKRDAADAARGAVTIIGLFLMITTPRYPWYYAWILPFLCFAPNIAWLYLTGASALLYLTWYTPYHYPGVPLWLGAALYGPTLALLGWQYLKERTAQSTLRKTTEPAASLSAK